MISSRGKKLKIICSLIILFAIAVMPLVGIGDSAVQAGEVHRRAPINPDFLEFWENPPEPFYGYIPPLMDLSHLDKIPVERAGGLPTLPATFDWRDQGKVTSVKDQNPCGTCWVFGTTSVLESAVLIAEDTEYNFSEQSVALCVDRSWVYLYDDPDEPCGLIPGHGGGNSFLASEVFIKKGAVLESCNSYNPSGLQCNGACVCDSCTPVKKVNGYRYVTGDQSQTGLIKDAVYNHGPVTMAFYYDDSHKYTNPTYGTVYDCATCTSTNHIVSIIGWNDSVPHFETPGTGAWLVKNSWGTGWGNSGYFWLAYDSSYMTGIAYLEYEDYEPDEQIYYWDEAGMVTGYSGWDDYSGWMASVFTSSQDGSLTHVDFWTTSNNAQYQIYVYRDGNISDDLQNLATSQSGTCDELGYYSIGLTSPVSLTNGESFIIAVKMTTPAYGFPIPVELQDVEYMGCEPPIQTDVCFVKHLDGDSWEDAASVLPPHPLNTCLRGKVITGAAEQPDITVSPDSFEKTLAPDTTQDYTLNIGNTGDATLTYTISDEETTAPTAMKGDSGHKGLLSGSASAVLEVPLEGSPVKPEDTGGVGSGWQNIMSDDFEGAFPGADWNVGAIGGYTDAYWGKDSYRYYSPSYSVFCAKEGTDGVNPPADYPDDINAWMVYGPFSLADATDAELNFNFWLAAEYEWDYLYYWASIDGYSFSGTYWTGYSDGWVEESFDLTDVYGLGNLCGQPQVWIAFTFQSDFMIGDEGAFIDDVVLRKLVNGVAPHIDSLSPTEGVVDSRVTISGSNFGPTQGTSIVKFNGINADISAWSDTEIAAWVPDGATTGNVVVHTGQGDSNAVPFTVTDSPVDYYAVIVGVADYPGTENDLDYPDEDAWDVRNALLADANWEESHITMLLDSDATKANIQSAIASMGSTGDGNDLFFFSYSGHGGNAADQPPLDEADGLDEFLAQYDFQTSPIWDDEFAEWLAALPSRKVAVSLDACYSGGQVKASGEGMVKCLAAEGIPARGDGFVRDIDDITGGVALAASDEDQYSWDVPAFQNGLYTYYFVEGLEGPADSNSDGIISMEEAFNYLNPLVSGYPVPEPQNPRMYDGYPDELVILLSELNNPPNTPSNPSPTNHATGVSINADLGWTGGDPDVGDTVTYDVYFGTSASPPLVSNDQSATTYDPGTLNDDTKYYWKIVATDNHAAPTSGPVWDFTTGGAGNGWQTIMTEDFEGDFPGTKWVEFGRGVVTCITQWVKDDHSCHGGSYSAWYERCTTPGNAGIAYGPFDLSDATDAELNFYYFYDLQECLDPGAEGLCFGWGASVGASIYTAPYYFGEEYCSPADSGGWQYESFDLTNVPGLGDLCGQSQVWVWFWGCNGCCYVDTGQGAFIDDIVLRKYTAGGPVDCPWLDEDPKSGSVAQGDPADAITVSIDTSGLSEGDYSANIVIANNDPDENPKIVPVTLHVTPPANNPPNTPSNPLPPNHAPNVSVPANLSWTGGDPDPGDTVSYDVYFGTSATPPLISNDQTGTTYDPGALSYNTKYYWKIVATDNHEASSTGPVWDFTTVSPPPEPTIAFSPESFSFSATEGGANPADQALEIWNSGGGTLDWSISDDADWLGLSPESGSSTGEHNAVTVSVDISGMSADDYSATITISAAGATNTPQTVPVDLTINPAVEEDNPDVATGLASIEDELVMVYNFDNATKTWTWYNPAWPAQQNTLDTLYKGKAYWIKVSADCVLVYETQSYDLYTGWNNIAWMGY